MRFRLTALLTKCEIIVAVFRMKPTEYDIKQDKAPWETCHQGNSSTSGFKQNHREQVGEIHILEKVCCLLSPEVIVWAKEHDQEMAHSYKVVYFDTETNNISVRSSWTLLEPEESLSCLWVLVQFQVELWSRQRMPAKGESPSSPFYVTVSMKTHQEECRRLHKRGSPVGSAKDKSEDDYPPMSKKMHLKCPLCGPNVQKKTWWNVSRVPFQWRKTDKIASGVPFHFIKCSAI